MRRNTYRANCFEFKMGQSAVFVLCKTSVNIDWTVLEICALQLNRHTQCERQNRTRNQFCSPLSKSDNIIEFFNPSKVNKCIASSTLQMDWEAKSITRFSFSLEQRMIYINFIYIPKKMNLKYNYFTECYSFYSMLYGSKRCVLKP